MGVDTHLRGEIMLQPEDFEVLMQIDNLCWRWEEKTIDDYLGQGWSYDSALKVLSIDAKRPMHNHPRLMGLLAWFQASDQTQTLEQKGAVQDAWFDSGRYFLENKKWGYVGRGTMVVGPESVLTGPDDPQTDDVHTWFKGFPPIQSIEDNGEQLQIRCFGGLTFTSSTTHLHDLARLTDDEREKPSVHADRIHWRHGRDNIIVKTETLWNQRIT